VLRHLAVEMFRRRRRLRGKCNLLPKIEVLATAGDQQELSAGFVFCLIRRIIRWKRCGDRFVQFRSLEREAGHRSKVASLRSFHRLAPVVCQLRNEILASEWTGIGCRHLFPNIPRAGGDVNTRLYLNQSSYALTGAKSSEQFIKDPPEDRSAQ